MKGGTAINFFHGSMPRLSMDIDVVFTDHTLSPGGEEIKFFLKRGDFIVKVEVNQVFRGTVIPVGWPNVILIEVSCDADNS